MDLSLGVIIDGFSEYKPVVHKIGDIKTQIRGFQYYSTEFTQNAPDYMYVSGAEKAGKAFRENCPKHIIISGNISKGLLEKAETLIQIPQGVTAEELIQTGNVLLASYEAWYNSLLMAVINHKPIGVFLDIAAQMLPNPTVVFNNNLSAICSAGAITGSTEGTIWEKFNAPGFVMDSFYTPQEIRDISSYISQKTELPHIIHPKNDPAAHSTLAAHIRIDGKHYGGIGLVDINKSFTEGQKEILFMIAKVLKLYFQNHSIYMRIAENKVNWLDGLLDGVDISTEIISNYLSGFQWKLDDNFCIVSLTTSDDLNIPIISILDIKQINCLFPDALVSVNEKYIVIIIRCADKKQPLGKKKEQLEQFLKKDILLRCGVSMVFNNFLHLRYYYTQSKFAAGQCKPPLDPAICLYEDYQEDHVLQTLSLGADPRCFCHPGILSLWESGSKLHRDMVHCLYHYFLNGRNISTTAEAIHVHRNTLIYRLSKAEEILNVDIKRPSVKQTFMFIISCMIVINSK